MFTMKSICFTSETAQEEHNAVGDHYGVPNDYGHDLVAGEIIMLLKAVNAHREEPENEPAFGTSHRPRILLDGNLDEDWGDCLYLQPILHHGEQKNHTVEITILPTEDETPTEFYLMALITA